MKRLTVIFVISVVLILVMLALAFSFVAFSAHNEYYYDILRDDELAGKAKIDRYVTEGKVIYKSRVELPYSREYVTIHRRLYLNKKNRLPIRYEEDAYGVRNSCRTTILEQKDGATEMLYFRSPVYFETSGYETGDRTLIFSEENIVAYLQVIDNYNFWRKGTQYFEIMVPMDAPIPVMRKKLEMRYLDDSYSGVMGRKVEAERFILRSQGMPEILLCLEKYSHFPLSVKIRKTGLDIIMKGHYRKFWGLFGRLSTEPDDLAFSRYKPEKNTDKAGDAPAYSTAEEVFFENGPLILAGRLWKPAKEGDPHPAVVFVSDDGPVMNAADKMFSALGKKLSESGVMVLDFDTSGKGKSQGNFRDVDDESLINQIISACRYLAGRNDVDAGNLSVLGYKGGGYLALKVSDMLADEISSCIVLGLPHNGPVIDPVNGINRDQLRYYLEREGVGAIDEDYTSKVVNTVNRHLENVAATDDGYVYFLRKKINVRAYRDYLAREPYREMANHGNPLLFIYGRDDKDHEIKLLESLKMVSGANEMIKVTEFRRLGEFLGEMSSEGDAVSFDLDKDVTGIIIGWIKKLGNSAE